MGAVHKASAFKIRFAAGFQIAQGFRDSRAALPVRLSSSTGHVLLHRSSLCEPAPHHRSRNIAARSLTTI